MSDDTSPADPQLPSSYPFCPTSRDGQAREGSEEEVNRVEPRPICAQTVWLVARLCSDGARYCVKHAHPDCLVHTRVPASAATAVSTAEPLLDFIRYGFTTQWFCHFRVGPAGITITYNTTCIAIHNKSSDRNDRRHVAVTHHILTGV